MVVQVTTVAAQGATSTGAKGVPALVDAADGTLQLPNLDAGGNLLVSDPTLVGVTGQGVASNEEIVAGLAAILSRLGFMDQANGATRVTIAAGTLPAVTTVSTVTGVTTVSTVTSQSQMSGISTIYDQYAQTQIGAGNIRARLTIS